MKNLIAVGLVSLLYVSLTLAQPSTPVPSVLTWQVTFTGTPNDVDRAAAEYVVTKHNEALAAQEPPGTPLPMGTPGNLKNSYLSILETTIANAHQSYVTQSAAESIETEDIRGLWKQATPAQRAAAKAALETP